MMMLHDQMPQNIWQAVGLAEDIVSGLMNAECEAIVYCRTSKSADYRKQKARLFLDALYTVDDAVCKLAGELNKVGDVFVLVANTPEQSGEIACESVHHLISFLASLIVSGVSNEILEAALPGRWPPVTSGEYVLPDRLPCREECLRYIDVAIKTFQSESRSLSLDLNILSARREQEVVRAVERLSRQPMGGPQVNAGANSANISKLFCGPVPEDPDLIDLAVHIDAEKNKPKNERRSNNKIALEITKETTIKGSKAASLLARLRREKRNGRVNL